MKKAAKQAPAKRKAKRAPEMDVNQLAQHLVRQSTGYEEAPTERSVRPKRVTPAEISRVMSVMGRKGGRVGGKRRIETLTPDERSQIALKAAQARWAKRTKS